MRPLAQHQQACTHIADAPHSSVPADRAVEPSDSGVRRRTFYRLREPPTDTAHGQPLRLRPSRTARAHDTWRRTATDCQSPQLDPPANGTGDGPPSVTADRHLLLLDTLITGSSEAQNDDAAINAALAAVLGIPGVTAAAYHQVERGRGIAVLRAGEGIPKGSESRLGRLPISAPPYHNALVQRQPVFVEDAALLGAGADLLAPFEALALIPVVAADDVIGGLSALCHAPREWAREEQLLLPLLGRQLGSALSRISALAALSDRRLPLHDLVNAVDDVLIVASGDGRLLWANAAAEKRLGYRRDEWHHMTMLDLYPPGRRIEAAAALADLLDDPSADHSVPLAARDGTLLRLQTTVLWGTWDNRRVIFIVGRRPPGNEAPDGTLLDAAVEAAAAIAYAHDPATAEHSRRVAIVATSLATELGLPKEHIAGVRLAASLHDVGKTAIPNDVLARPGRLTGPELALVRAHPEAGSAMVRHTAAPLPLSEIILQHHERLDGSGYPRGLRGKDILPEARILAVADVFEAMSSNRPYRGAYSVDEALEELQRGSGRRYDSDVVAACVHLGDHLLPASA